MRTNRDELKTEYFNYLEEVSYFSKSDKQTDLVLSFCKNIISSILQTKSPHKLLNINILRMAKYANSDDEDNVKLAVYYLSIPPVNIIDWVYEANNIFSESNDDEDVIEVSQEEILTCIKSKNYVNPFDGNTLTEAQFESMINVVFRVSRKFIAKYNNEVEHRY